MISDRTANILIGVVTVMWAANLLAAMFKLNGYTSSESINGIFLLVVGGAFTYRYRAKAEDGDKK